MHMQSRRLLARGLSTAAVRIELPSLRLPTTIFPGQPFSMTVADLSKDDRPRPGQVTAALVDEIIEKHAGRVALLADGQTVGTIADVRAPNPGDRTLLTHQPSSPTNAGMALHMIGESRVHLLQTLDRTPAGGRLAAFEPIEDEPMSADETRRLEDETTVANALLSDEKRNNTGENWELLLSQLDEELFDGLSDPTAHPLWLACGRVPEDPVALSYWLSCRLPLTTALRIHLLGITSPLKRMRDVVDALRLLCDPSRASASRFAKFELLWQTAEASGCELEPPRAVVHWRGEAYNASRY